MSQWYDGLSEKSRSRNCILENFMTLWNFEACRVNIRTEVCPRTARSSDHHALDQRSWDCKVNCRTLWHRDRLWSELISRTSIWVGAMSCVRIFKKLLNTQIHFRKRVSVEEQRAEDTRPILYEEDKLRTWSMSISVQPKLVKQYQDSQSSSL